MEINFQELKYLKDLAKENDIILTDLLLFLVLQAISSDIEEVSQHD